MLSPSFPVSNEYDTSKAPPGASATLTTGTMNLKELYISESFGARSTFQFGLRRRLG